MLFEPYVCFHILVEFGQLSGRLWGITAHSAYGMFSWYKYLSVILVFSHPSVCEVGISF